MDIQQIQKCSRSVIWRALIFTVRCQISHYQFPENLWLRQLGNSKRRFTSFRDSFRDKCYSHAPADQFKQGFKIADFEGNMPANAGSEKSMVDQFPRAPVRFEIDKRLVLQRSEGDVVRSSKSVTWSASDNERLTSDHIGFDIV